MVNNPQYVIELASHTDSRPFLRVTNDTLSQRRAESVVEFLVARGIDRDRLVPKGYGDRIPRTLKTNCVSEFGAIAGIPRADNKHTSFIDFVITNNLPVSGNCLNP